MKKKSKRYERVRSLFEKKLWGKPLPFFSRSKARARLLPSIEKRPPQKLQNMDSGSPRGGAKGREQAPMRPTRKPFPSPAARPVQGPAPGAGARNTKKATAACAVAFFGDEWDCKPGSVNACASRDHLSSHTVTAMLGVASCHLWDSDGTPLLSHSQAVLLRIGFTLPPQSPETR